MPIQQRYYLNAPTLAEATAAYTDNWMTTCAADGMYSDGTIVRELVDCRFISSIPIPPCNPPCNPPAPIITALSPATDGVFDMAIHTGTAPGSTGAIVIEIYNNLVSGYIGGFEVEFDGVEYNKIGTSEYGIQYADPGYPTFIGIEDVACIDPFTGGSFTGDIYDWDGSVFINSGLSLFYSVDIAFNQNKTTVLDPGRCVMVIPKLLTTTDIINIRAYIPCHSSQWVITVHCPQLLPSFFRSVGVDVDPVGDPVFCAYTLTEKFYYAKVKDDYPGLMDQYDLVFTDPYGQNALPDGYYKVDPAYTPSGLADTIYVVNGEISSASLVSC